MKIIKVSGVSKISNEEIKRELLSSPSLEKTYSLLNEAYNRKYIDAFYVASDNPQNVNNLSILKLMTSIIVSNPQHHASIAILDNILEYAENIDASVIIRINGVALSNPPIATTILLHQYSPNTLVDSIINNLHLNIVKRTDLNDKFLSDIIDALKNGDSWNNERSGLIMASRVVQYPQDSFLTEVSKYNLTPPLASVLMNASNLYKSQNPSLYENLKNNTNPGIEIAKFVNDLKDADISPNAILPGLIVSLEKSKYQPYYQHIWNLIKDKISKWTEWEKQIFTSNYGGINFLKSLLDVMPDILPDLIDIIKASKNIDIIKKTPIYEEIIHRGLSNPSFQAKTLELPEDRFSMIRMTKENQEIVKNHFHPEIKGWQDLEELMANNNWYIKYATSKELLKEAGWKENIITSLLAAILTVLGGSTIANASKKYNVKEEDLQKAMQNTELVTQAKELKENKEEIKLSNVSFDDIFNFISNNECYKDKYNKPILNLKAYIDPSKKNMSIGAGFNLDRPQAKKIIEDMGLNYNQVRNGQEYITENQAKQLFKYDANLALNIAKSFVNNFDQLPSEIKLVLIDMAYNMGENRLSQFKKFKKAIEEYDFLTASNELKNSKWFTQVKNRSQRSIDLITKLIPPEQIVAQI